MPLQILVEGRPGSGKTTVAARLADRLRAVRVPVRGFVTHEVRVQGVRLGFEVATLQGRKAMLAHVDFAGPPRVGKYGVDLDAFERVALPALARPPKNGVVLVDELGKMELASSRFRDRVVELLAEPVHLVATIHVARHPFTDALKRRVDVERVQVTRANRDELPALLAERLLAR